MTRRSCGKADCGMDYKRLNREARHSSPADCVQSGRNGPPRFVVFTLGVALGVFVSRRLELDSGGD